MVKHIVKRQGHTEAFDERKLYGSIYSACFSVRQPSATAELLAEKVVEDVKKWLEPKTEVTSSDIQRIAYRHLNVYHEDAAWMYKHHRNID